MKPVPRFGQIRLKWHEGETRSLALGLSLSSFCVGSYIFVLGTCFVF